MGPWPCSGALLVLLATLLGQDGAVKALTCRLSEYKDLTSRYLQADIVFDGSFVGRSSSHNGRYNATFHVLNVHKGQLPRGTVGSIQGEYLPVIAGLFSLHHDPSSCDPTISIGEHYLVFLQRQAEDGVPFYPLHAAPEYASKRTLRKLEDTKHCIKEGPACLSPATASASRVEVQTEGGATIDLRCKVGGHPAPLVEWVKDQKKLRGSAGTDIHTNKRGSRLRLEKVKPDDEGVYLCYAKNVIGSSVAQINLKVIGGIVPEPHETRCEVQTYCLNGGTCYYLRDLGTKFCKCSDNFMGTRCQFQDLFTVLRTMKSRDELKFDRTMTIAGIVIGALVLVAMCIAAYCMAKNKREQFYKKKALREKLKKQQQKEEIKPPPSPQPNGMLGNMMNPSGVITRARAESSRSYKSTTTQTAPETQPSMRWQSQPTGICGHNSPPPVYNSGRRSRSGSTTSGHSLGYAARDGRRRLHGMSSSAEVIDDRLRTHPNFIVNAVVESDQDASKRSPSQNSKTESAHGHLGLEPLIAANPQWQGSVGSLEEDDQASDYDNHGSDGDLASDGPSQRNDACSGSPESHPREMEVSSSSETSDTDETSSGPGEEQALFERLKSNPPIINNPKRQSPSWHEDFMPNHYMFNPYAREKDIVPSKYMQNPPQTKNENDHYNYIYSPENYMDGPVQLIDPDPDATVV